jgi:ribosomal protein L44E
MKEERATNAAKYAAKCKEWREANPEKVKEYDAAYKAAHKDQAAAAHKKWAEANKDAIKANKQIVITCAVCGQQTTKGNKWRHDKTHE